MCAVSQEQLATAGRRRQRHQRVKRRRATFLVAVVLVLTGVAVTLIKLRQQINTQNAAVASPVASTDPGLGELPPSRTIASAGPVEINLPVDRKFAKVTLFRPIDRADGVAMSPDDSWKHAVWSAAAVGPRTAGMDIAAPAGTIVYSPVTGHVSGVRDYVVGGRTAGFELDISPDAASDVVVRVQSITTVPMERDARTVCRSWDVKRPKVGMVVIAGVTCLGQVLDVANDLGDITRPLIAKYTSDGGNHVHLEVVRVPS